MRIEKKVEKKEGQPTQKPGLVGKDTPQPVVKILALAVLTVLATGLFWFLVANILQHGISLARGQNNAVMILWVILAFCLMFAIIGLAGVMIRNMIWFLLIIIVSSCTYLVFFRFNMWSLGPLILFFLAFWYWRQSVQSDMKSRIKFLPKKIMSVGLHSAIALTILAVAFAYASFFVSSQGGSSRVADGIAKAIAQAVNNIMPMAYKGYKPSMTLDEFIVGSSTITGTEVIPEGAGKTQNIAKEALTAAQKKAVEESRNEMLKTLNIEAKGDEPMRSVIEKAVSQKIVPALKPYEKFIPLVMVLTLYFILSIFIFVYKILIESFSFIIFMIMKWAKFVQIKKVSVEADRLTL